MGKGSFLLLEDKSSVFAVNHAQYIDFAQVDNVNIDKVLHVSVLSIELKRQRFTAVAQRNKGQTLRGYIEL